MSERLPVEELRNPRRGEKGTIRRLLGRGHALGECEHAAETAVEVPRVMVPMRVKESSKSYYPNGAIATYNILGQAYIYPIGGKLPDIQKQHVYGLRKGLCLIDRVDIEAQD